MAWTLLLVSVVPGAMAQSPQDALVDKIEQKASEAERDPLGYAQNQTSASQIQEDVRWAVAYACYGFEYVSEETGVPTPDLEACEDYQDALGQEKENETDEGSAEPLESNVVEEGQDLIDEGLNGARRILDDPTEAPKETQSLLERALAFVGRVFSTALGTADALVDTVVELGDALVRGLAGLLGGLGGTLLEVWRTLTDAVESLGASLTDWAGAVWQYVTGALVDSAHTVTNAMEDAASVVRDAAADVGHQVQSLVDSLLHREPESPDPSRRTSNPTQDVTDKVSRLTDRLLEVPKSV